MDVEATVRRVVAAHQRLQALADGLTDEQMRRPSRLPGWTRGHVLAHLADNARAFERQARSPRPVDMYDGGKAARDASIEEQAQRPAEQLRQLLRTSSAALEQAWQEVPAAGWERPVRFRNGTLAGTVPARWREAEIHAVDLGLAYAARDWPVDFALHALDFLLPRLPADRPLTLHATDLDRRWAAGPDDPRAGQGDARGSEDDARAGETVTVSGPLHGIVSWMAGRDDGGDLWPSTPALPALGPWPPDPADDTAAIAELVRVFFAAFVSGPDVTGRLDALPAILLPQALIIRAGGPEPAVYDVAAFIEPRRALLTSGRLTGFREWEIAGRTTVLGDIAQHWCSYAKQGRQDGMPFTGRGHKTFQFVRTPPGWLISSVSWHDR